MTTIYFVESEWKDPLAMQEEMDFQEQMGAEVETIEYLDEVPMGASYDAGYGLRRKIKMPDFC